ncbi:MAG: MBL fold metallo-hydrolase [Sedimentisphaerales bacterium]|nr:MBL fold metallo-hydrolase [Sedimentisphaerales bacterium]
MSETIRLTILVDNTSDRHTLLAEHGWAVWIEDDRHNILFDTGQSGIVQTNAQMLRIDLSQVDAIVLSHGHYDHTGGLMRVLDGAGRTDVYVHPEALQPKYSCSANAPNRNIGMPALTTLNLAQHQSVQNLVWTQQPTQIIPGCGVTGFIPRRTRFEDVGGPFFRDAFGTEPDSIPDDQALFFDSADGLVVILGCAHAGVVNTLDWIAELTGRKEFFAVLGGMHLGSASAERIEQTIEAFRAYNIQRIGAAHCTGTKAAASLWQAFPDRCLSCSVGTQMEFEKGADSDRPLSISKPKN